MQWRPWLLRHRDAVLSGLAFAGLAGELLAWEDAELAAALPLAALTAAALYWRRTQPVPAFIATAVAMGSISAFAPAFDSGSSTFVLIYFLALFSLGAHTRGREVAVAALLVVVAIGVFVYSDGDDFAVGDIVFGIVFVGGPWATGLAIRLRSEIARSHAELEREQEERERRAVTAERTRIARELHDVVSHAISVTVLQARGARRTLDSDPAAVREALDAIERTNTSALGDMRRLLAVLRDTETTDEADDHAPLPSLAHLDDLLRQVRSSGIPVEVETVGDARGLPPGVDLSAYRIVQEALTNVLKHSADATARVVLEYGDADLAVTVVDDGAPRVNGAAAPGRGLIGIRERVSVVGGEVVAGPRDGGGFEVRARLPYSLEVS